MQSTYSTYFIYAEFFASYYFHFFALIFISHFFFTFYLTFYFLFHRPFSFLSVLFLLCFFAFLSLFFAAFFLKKNSQRIRVFLSFYIISLPKAMSSFPKPECRRFPNRLPDIYLRIKFASTRQFKKSKAK